MEDEGLDESPPGPGAVAEHLLELLELRVLRGWTNGLRSVCAKADERGLTARDRRLIGNPAALIVKETQLRTLPRSADRTQHPPRFSQNGKRALERNRPALDSRRSEQGERLNGERPRRGDIHPRHDRQGRRQEERRRRNQCVRPNHTTDGNDHALPAGSPARDRRPRNRLRSRPGDEKVLREEQQGGEGNGARGTRETVEGNHLPRL